MSFKEYTLQPTHQYNKQWKCTAFCLPFCFLQKVRHFLKIFLKTCLIHEKGRGKPLSFLYIVTEHTCFHNFYLLY